MPNPPPADSIEWTVLKVLRWAASYLKERGLDSPRTDAEILLAHALDTGRVQLYMHHDKPLEKAELARFKELIHRRLRREPVAYITGRKGFWTLDLAVDPAVLIPRPETECLVEAALAILAEIPEGQCGRILDLGTGSGAIALALACERRDGRFFASDLSPAAAAAARRNAAAAGLADRVFCFVADWLAAVKPADGGFDLIVSNPPYVESAAIARLQPEIAGFEPALALDGDADGLRSYRAIIGEAHRFLKPGGALVLEIGFDQQRAVEQIAAQAGCYQNLRCTRDYSDLDRVVTLRKKRVATP